MLLGTMFGLHPFLKKLFADAAYQGPEFRNSLASVAPCVEIEIVKRSDCAKKFVCDQMTQDVAQIVHATREHVCRPSWSSI